MMMCPLHRAELKAAIVSRGMGELVSADPASALQKVFHRGSGIESFDPFMEAHSAIVNAAIEMIGLGPLLPTVDGFPCPICTLIRLHAECACGNPACEFEADMNTWIPHAADACRATVDEMVGTSNPS